MATALAAEFSFRSVKFTQKYTRKVKSLRERGDSFKEDIDYSP